MAARIPIVPVLVWGATMPSESDLPKSLRLLTRLHAVERATAGGPPAAEADRPPRRMAWSGEGTDPDLAGQVELVSTIDLPDDVRVGDTGAAGAARR